MPPLAITDDELGLWSTWRAGDRQATERQCALLVTGTDTGVGKTLSRARSRTRGARRDGRRRVKLVETGVEGDRRRAAARRCGDDRSPPDDVFHRRGHRGAGARRLEGVVVDLDRIAALIERGAARWTR
jgi:hypothetical protein